MLSLDCLIQISGVYTNSNGPIWFCYNDQTVDPTSTLFTRLMIPSLTIRDNSFFTLSLMVTGIRLGGCMTGVTEESL